MTVTAVVVGCSGPVLTDAERRFFRDLDPWGFIIFRRNVDTREAARALTHDLRDTVGREAPVLVDQEGGRVQRLGPPLWRRYPAAATFARLAALRSGSSATLCASQPG